MPGDPFKIFREDEEYRREAVKTIWPELYASLALPDLPRRAWGCALSPHRRGERREYAPVTGRLWLNGPPACAECIARSSDRPGGYPLALVEKTMDWQG